jgi:hypothetical protein
MQDMLQTLPPHAQQAIAASFGPQQSGNRS